MNADSPNVSPSSSKAVGWHYRGYLPHLDHPGLVQAVTFRLADALPAARLADLHADQRSLNDRAYRRQMEAVLDAGHGGCELRSPQIARLVESALLHFDGERYRLLSWVIMPNHVHVLMETIPGYWLPDIVQSWKSFTAKEANKLLGRAGRFWQREYFDRVIRNERHLASAVQYIHNNPVTAGLATDAEAWPFSSATRWREGDEGRQDAGAPGPA